MQMEMEKGGKFFFDLFVALCNFMVGWTVFLLLLGFMGGC